MLLLDSNVIPEIILNRAAAADAAQLRRSGRFALFLSEFSLGTICYLPGKQKELRYFDALRVLLLGRVSVVQLSLAENVVDVPAIILNAT